MFIKNKFVSLCKGQNQGESSPYSNVLKNIMSPCSVQNRVSPDYVSISCADKSMDLMMQLLKKKVDKIDIVRIVDGIFTTYIPKGILEMYKRQFHTVFGSVDGSLVV